MLRNLKFITMNLENPHRLNYQHERYCYDGISLILTKLYSRINLHDCILSIVLFFFWAVILKFLIRNLEIYIAQYLLGISLSPCIIISSVNIKI